MECAGWAKDFSIQQISPLAAKPGELVSVTGDKIRICSQVKVAGMALYLNKIDDTHGTFVMPEKLGTKQIDVVSANSAKLVSDGADDGIPIITADPSLICSTVTFYNAKGEKTNGTKNCGQLATSSSSSGSSCPTTTPVSCTQEGQNSCLTNDSFVVVEKSKLTSGNVKAGVILGGVTGAYPSATYPLSANTSTPDLELATFNAKIKASAAFEWFDSSGNVYVNAGSTSLDAVNIKNGVTVFGSTGTFAPDCAADGQISCFTTSAYPALKAAGISSWDIRKGKTVGGINGNLSFFKNMANTTLLNLDVPQSVTSINTGTSQLTVPSHGFSSNDTIWLDYFTQPTPLAYGTNYYVIIVDANTIQLSTTSGPGSAVTITASGSGVIVYRKNPSALASIDYYDTIDDYDNGGAFPTQAPTGWDQATGGNWANLTTGVYRDELTGLVWAKDDGVLRNWGTAVIYCKLLNYGGRTDWRLPTQKELLQGYIDGVASLKSAANLNISNNYYWTATALSTTTKDILFVNVITGGTVSQNRMNNTINNICVAP